METVEDFDEGEEIFNLPISYEEKGKQKGLEEGIDKGKKEVALELLKEGVSIELIKKTTKLSVDEIKELRKHI